MAGWIDYKEGSIAFNNRQFSSTMRFVTDVAQKMAKGHELSFVHKMKEEMVDNYYPGMCITIEKDFPKIEERKFWARMFFETAREIFERKIGIQDYSFWQSERIYQIYGAGNLFAKAVRDDEPKWIPDIRDYSEFDEWANNRNN